MGEDILVELKGPHIVVLIALLKAKVLTHYEVRTLLGKGQPTSTRYSNSVLLKLMELGLVEEIRKKRVRLFILTERGRGVARALAEAFSGL